MSEEIKEQLKGLSILCLEDEAMIRQGLVRFLSRYFETVYEAENGEEGLEIFKKHRPGFVLADIMMPIMNGLEFTRAAKEIMPDVQVVVASAYDDKEFFLEAIRLGVDGYIIKPVDREVLLETLSKCARLHHLRRESQEANQQRALILASANEGIFGLDKEGMHTFINPSAARMLGYTQEELIGRHSHGIWHHTRADGTAFPSEMCPIYSVLSSGKPIEVRKDLFWRKDGSSFFADYAANPIIKDGVVTGAVVSFSDATARLEEQKQMRLLSLAVDQSYNSILITDTQGNIEYVNPRFVEINGYSKEEVIGQRPSLLKSGKTPQQLYQEMWCALRGGKSWSGEVINTKKDGSTYWSRLSIFPIRDESGTTLRYVGISDDITQKKQFEEKLKNINAELERRIKEEIAKNREKDQQLFEQSKFVAMGDVIKDIAHHWRQPLTAIGMLIQNIRDAYVYDELSEPYLNETTEKAMNQLQYMSKTIDNFRTFFKPDAKLVSFDLHKAATDALYMVLAQMQGHGVEVRVEESPEALPMVMGYPNEFKQVVLNILKNAMDAILKRQEHTQDYQGSITLSFSTQADHVQLVILDDGGGIDPAIIDKVFDPYFTTKEQGKGVGVGLYMSKVLIEKNMNGTIKALNRKEGAEFTIELPIPA